MLESYIAGDFSGAVSVYHGEQPIFERAYGFSDRPNRIANQPGTRFATASAGKAFVAVGICRLIEEAKLNLQTSIGELLAFPLNQIDPGITVHQLLNHTSGIPDYFDESVMEEYADLFRDFPNYRIRRSADLLPLFIDKPMMYPRGERFQYNNSGYVVLGLILERMTGQPFDDYLDAAIFQPLCMESTGYYELDRLPARCASAYILDKATGEFYTNIYSVDVKGTGAGGAFTTTGDVHRFWQGLRSGSVVSPQTFAQMTAPQSEGGPYGYGFWLTEDGTPYFQGSDPGVSFISSHDTARQITITLISNLGQDVWSMHSSICGAVAGL